MPAKNRVLVFLIVFVVRQQKQNEHELMVVADGGDEPE
jgi:hypothetical protein